MPTNNYLVDALLQSNNDELIFHSKVFILLNIIFKLFSLKSLLSCELNQKVLAERKEIAFSQHQDGKTESSNSIQLEKF